MFTSNEVTPHLRDVYEGSLGFPPHRNNLKTHVQVCNIIIIME